MGDPKRRRKKYETPMHPWIKARITEELELKKKFGLKNKKEIWKLESKLKGFKKQIKNLIALKTAQADKEMDLLMKKLLKYGFTTEDSTPDDVLALTIDSIMERRLQDVVVKRQLARTPKQARQFITHRHITVSGKKVSSPNYLVSINEETTVAFSENSALSNPEHAERFVEKFTEEEKKEIAAEKPKKEREKRAKEDKKKQAKERKKPKKKTKVTKKKTKEKKEDKKPKKN
jgi:small subunit ribosomal protein S4